MWTLMLEFTTHLGEQREVYLPFFNTAPECLGWIDALKGLLNSAHAELTSAACEFRPTAILN